MIDKWILKDIELSIKNRKCVVILDTKIQIEFVLPLLESKGYILFKTDSSLVEQWQTEKEELFLRHKAETEHQDDNVIFYVNREKNKLSFLFDYCFTHGCLDLSNPVEWLKNKLFENTGLQIQMDNSLLLTAAKQSIGKDIAWWKKILQNLEELVNLENELIPFLDDPEPYLNSKDNDIRRLFEEKLFELLGQPYISKPPKTLADEVVKKILDGLVNNNISSAMLQLYYRWADSETYSPSLLNYVTNYKLNKSYDPWKAHPDHCFQEIDLKALKLFSENLRDDFYISDKINQINRRLKHSKAKRFVPSWWQDIVILINYNSNSLITCNTFSKVVEFYEKNFSKVDRAIRNLYVAFLHEKAVIRPLQEYYEILNHDLLQKWFEYIHEYKSDQAGYLINLLKKTKPRVAVIVGDGVRYEIADYVASSLEKKFYVEKEIMLAEMPSETENNMSVLYAGKNNVLPIHKDREKVLTNITDKQISYINIEAISYGEIADYLVITYKDIDSSGEKLQLGALKLFEEFEQVLTEKITQLLNSGYLEVYLVTDHGFVLTGLLDESDKIIPDASGKKEVHERFIRTVDKQNNSNWIEFDAQYGDYKYVYSAKSHRPFKSKGVYGFSHGGFTPQEIIIPKFLFKKKESSTASLLINISNKSELSDVTGEIFGIKLIATAQEHDLFAVKRKVKISIYADNVNFSNSSIINMEPDHTETVEFSFNGEMEVNAVLLDAETQEQLDVVTIKKSNVRDLGGL